MKPNLQIFIFLQLLALYGPASFGQVNFLGKPGVMTTPSAKWEENRQLGLSFGYVPRNYSHELMKTRYSSPAGNNLNFFNARVGLTSFLEVNLSMAYRPGISDEIGLGDRHVDFRFRLLEETVFLPSVVLGWTPPGSVSPVMAHDYLVLTKNFVAMWGRIELTGGVGSPYIFRKNVEHEGILDYLQIVKKSSLVNAEYLTGFFGSFTYSPVNFAGVMLEYNTSTINAGAYLKVNDWLHFQVYTFEGKAFAFQMALDVPLDFKPFALRRYEKKLD